MGVTKVRMRWIKTMSIRTVGRGDKSVGKVLIKTPGSKKRG